VLASLLLHFLAALSVLLVWMQTTRPPRTVEQIVPVDVVIRLAEQTRSPASPNTEPVPQQSVRRPEAKVSTAPRTPEGAAPHRTRPLPIDDLDAKLRGLARLRAPTTKLPVLENATGAIDATSPGASPGDEATYSVRDFVREQAERRWNLDFTRLGARRFTIPIHVVMRSDGTIVSAEVVDKERAASDAVYRSIALSARNALLLSSPIALPAGEYNSTLDMTLDFNPRDMVR
jgi:hypothetical protein